MRKGEFVRENKGFSADVTIGLFPFADVTIGLFPFAEVTIGLQSLILADVTIGLISLLSTSNVKRNVQSLGWL
jgi:hypothetical protein